MALGRALVDKGRVVSRQESVQKVDGEVQYTTVTDQKPFHCRLIMAQGTESDADGRRKSVRRDRIMYRRKGTVTSGDRIEVISKELGTATYQVDGDPKPIRKRRTVLGWTSNLVKATS